MRGIALLLLPALAAADEPLWTERPRASAPVAAGPDFPRLVRAVAPAVVNVSVRGVEAASKMRETMGLPPPVSVGSGFVIRKDGLCLTGYHVVEGGGTIRVRTVDGEDLDASVAGADERTDLALLRIRAPHPLPVVPLGDSDALRIGEWVLAIGNPLGLEHSVSVGIVSAKGRRELPIERDLYQDFIQTDASINPGSSGGPLVNARGEVVGIATAVNREGQGIGFATPINMAKTLLPILFSSGRVRRSWIGIVIQPGDLTPALMRAFRAPGAQGALVTEVVAGSPGARAGLRPGDVIVELDGKRLARTGDLPWLASLAGVGRRVKLSVLRQGKPLSVELALAEMPEETPAAPAPPAPRAHGAIGVTVTEVAEDMARVLQLDGRLVVTDLEPGGIAEKAGLEPGDVVLEVNGRAVRTVDDYFAVLKGAPPGEMMRMLVRRGGRSLWVAFEKGK
jgi:serine protease Do